MPRIAEFYKGRRKKRNYALVPFAVLLGVIALIVVTFYAMQQYAVITQDGVSVELPILSEEKTTVDSEGNIVKAFDTVDVKLNFGEPDYSFIKAVAGENTPEMRAIFVPAENFNQDKLNEYAGRLKLGNALVIEMKPRSGNLLWESQSQIAFSYGLSRSTEATAAAPGLIKMLKDQNIYLIAQISCCIDELYASQSTSVTLRTESGSNYSDDFGVWLDPYNENVRTYTVDLVRELYAMGFDEVVLADVRHPALEADVTLSYTRQMSTAPGAVNAVCGFAVSVAQELSDRSGLLSIYCDSAPALVKPDTATGQDAQLFMKLYDRVYYLTDKWKYPYNVTDIESGVTVGDVHNRLVPVVENYLPDDNDTWVLVDVAEEEEDD